MISIYDIKSWSDVAAFVVWTLAVCAIAKAVFGSLFAAEIHYRRALSDAPRRQRMNRLNWEINNRAAWNEDAARRSPHAAKQPLADQEIESRRRELEQLARTSFVWRAATYFMGCFACQTFWTALAVFAITHGVGTGAEWLLTSAAFSGAAATVASMSRTLQAAPGSDTPRKPACKSCGK